MSLVQGAVVSEPGEGLGALSPMLASTGKDFRGDSVAPFTQPTAHENLP